MTTDCEICGDEPTDPDELVPCESCDYLMCDTCKSVDGQCIVCVPPVEPQDEGLEPHF